MTMETPEKIYRDTLELLLARTEEVREAQKTFFRQRNDTNKNKAIKLERQLDEVVVTLKRKGFNGDRFKGQATSANLF